MKSPIAIVGLSCLYPEARTPMELWENTLAQRRAFRQIPSERLSSRDYLSTDPQAPDKTYVAQAALIEGYEFDRVAFRVVGSTYRSADLAHWLALDLASQALADAGFKDGEQLPREATGVILGNTLTGEFSRANLMRLRWPYVRRVLEAALLERGWTAEQRHEFLQEVEGEYKAPFPPVGEETLAGGLSNTIAGRICNQFDLKGGGYTVDGACASSLLAVGNACSSLAAGDLDVALAGGVDLSLDPFEIIGFAKTRALAPELMRVYDARSAGFWPGEGCGFAVLMREADAIAQRRRIYAVIRGWGISSDGSGGITRPEADGQLQAIRRAYQRAGYGIDTVEYFEGHGTGTSLGDTTELKVISRARRESRPDASTAVIGSIKANIGHTKAAAGIAGLLKAVMAVHTQTLPPTAGWEKPHPELGGPAPALRVLRAPEPWPAERPLRASVSAMGFGGINTHVTLEGTASERRPHISSRERTLARSPQDAELFLLGAADADGLAGQVEKLLSFASRLSLSELADLAAELSRRLAESRIRAALIASSPRELAQRLATLRDWLLDGATAKIDFQEGVFLGGGTNLPRVGFLFPGQGSPAHLDGGLLRRRFDSVGALYDQANLPESGEGISTEVAQPAIVTGSLAGLKILSEVGLEASVAVGHSLGEITALHWAGAFDEGSLLRIARGRGQAMAGLPGPTGAMTAIAAPAREVRALFDGELVSIVGFNSPRQTVIAGEVSAVNAVSERAQARGLRAVRLPVSHAFHTPLVAAAAPLLAQHLSHERMQAPQRHLVSTVTGAALRPEENLGELLCRQVTSPVRFIEAVTTAAKGVDLFIEVGPGEVLAGLAGDSVSVPIIALDAGGASLKGLLRAVGAGFALGAPIRPAALFQGRFTRPFNLEWQPKFFFNPCELAPESALAEHEPRTELSEASVPDSPRQIQIEPRKPALSDTPLSALDLVRQLVAERTELPVAAVKEESRLLSDLHLNSISVGQLMVEAAKRLNLSPLLGLTDFANATVAGAAQALQELMRSGVSNPAAAKASVPSGVDSWVRAFTVEWIQIPLPALSPGDNVEVKRLETVSPRSTPLMTMPRSTAWEVVAPPGHPLAQSLQEILAGEEGGGVVVCLPVAMNESYLDLLLQGARAALAKGKNTRFVLVHHGSGANGLARTLHLESPEITVCIVEVPSGHPQAPFWVRREAHAAHGFVEARYDVSGERWEPRLRLLSLPAAAGESPLGSDDVLLVTGGGKGIAAECALSIARNSGARLLLLGRAEPATDPELENNLRRMRAAGISCRYFAADVTDAVAVRAAIESGEREMGTVTAFLHAAGVNVPQLLGSLDEASFRRTLAPKIQGARNVLAAIRPDRLRLFVTFGSIIGRAGLAGEADYAVANEWLTQLTEEFQAAHPSCRCLAAEWSVWSGVGMGARLGRLESLRQQGITPISPEAGVEILEQLLRSPLPATSVVISGRFGDLPTLKLDKADLPFLRFLELPRIFYPGIELVVDANLSSDADPYVDDHVYHGERLFPAVMGLEAMAQAAMALVGSPDAPAFEDVQLLRPIVVPRNGRVTIRVACLVRGPGVVEVLVRTSENDFQADHFRATCRFQDGASLLRDSVPVLKSRIAEFKGTRVPLDPVDDLYADLLFHTGRFQRVLNYRLLRAHECVVQVEPDTKSAWFGRYLPQDRVLGDTGVRDAAIHAIQACIPHARLLPISVRRVVIGKIPCLLEKLRALGPVGAPPELLLHARQVSRDGDTFHYDLELLGEDGSVLEMWEGLCLRKVEELTRRRPWTEALLAPYIERRLEELIPSARISVALERTAASDDAIQHALGEEGVVQRRADGKPEVAGGRAVSVAHAGAMTLAVAGSAPLGCDLELATPRPSETWRDLLGPERFRLAELIGKQEDFNTAATRVWSAVECLKKAGAMSGAPLVLGSIQNDGWILLSSGALTIATCSAELSGLPAPIVLATACAAS